ncbi:MAG: glycosyltransferase family 4 protein [Caldimicrobium sp.]
MRKIGILTIATKEQGGIYQYTLSQIEAIRLLLSKFRVVQIRNQKFPKLFEDEVIIERDSSILSLIKSAIHGLFNIKIGSLPFKIISGSFNKIDLIISPIISLIPHHIGIPYIVTIHDFQHKYYPQFFSLKQRLGRKIIYRTGIFAKLIIVESNYVKQDLIKFLGISENKVKVLPSPPPSYLRVIEINEDKICEIVRRYDLPEKYIFYPAQFWYHKNHINLLESIKFIKQKYGEVIYLVLVGAKQNNFENTMKKVMELGLTDQVKYLGYVPNEDLPYLYKLSTALVMPTLFESVSLPIWEAFYLGVPVVSSNVCALPEQVGDASLLFDPHNPLDMAEEIYKIWTDEELREELVRKGKERVKNLTIENYAQELEKVIEEAISNIK